LLFALTSEPGPPPARGIRLMDSAPRDGPLLAA
jgi:hypothetical protein